METLNIGWISFIFLVFSIKATAEGAPCIPANSTVRPCLDVFTHTPGNLPKCYCTTLCEQNLSELVKTCSSGQLLPDSCGTCLTCAKAQGERCGGRHNVLGVCGAGLRCYIEFKDDPEKNILKTRDAENIAIGICVRENYSKCPTPDLETLSSVSCRPGAFGILAEALYCPTGIIKPFAPPKSQSYLPKIFDILLAQF